MAQHTYTVYYEENGRTYSQVVAVDDHHTAYDTAQDFIREVLISAAGSLLLTAITGFDIGDTTKS